MCNKSRNIVPDSVFVKVKFCRKFSVNLDSNSVLQNYCTNNQEAKKFITIDDFNNFRKQLEKQLQNTEIRIQNQITEKILHNIRKPTTQTRIIPQEPFSCLDDFLKYDAEIQNDEKKLCQLINEFDCQEARDLLHYVKLNWRKILTDCAAQHMCWNGTDKKKPIRTLAVTQALKAACIRKYNNEADLQFTKMSALHFQHAKGRHEKKLNYKRKPKAAE